MIYTFPIVTASLDLVSDIIAALASHQTLESCGNVGKLHCFTASRPSFPLQSLQSFPDDPMSFAWSTLWQRTGTRRNMLPNVHGRLYRLQAMKLQGRLAQGDWAAQKVGGIPGIKAVVASKFR
jgi:4-hydroxy-2-oxoglutarate aldolase